MTLITTTQRLDLVVNDLLNAIYISIALAKSLHVISFRTNPTSPLPGMTSQSQQ
jgi:hypothetical protein